MMLRNSLSLRNSQVSKTQNRAPFPESLKLGSQTNPMLAMAEIWAWTNPSKASQPALANFQSKLNHAENFPEFAKLTSFKDSEAHAFP